MTPSGTLAGSSSVCRPPDCNRSGTCTPGGQSHLLVRNLSMLGFVIRNEIGESFQPTIVFQLGTKRLVNPGADSFRASARDGVFHSLNQFGIHRNRQTLLAHKTILI